MCPSQPSDRIGVMLRDDKGKLRQEIGEALKLRKPVYLICRKTKRNLASRNSWLMKFQSSTK